MTYMTDFHEGGWGGKLRPSFDWEAHTLERLQWAHGIGRAALIVAGLDPETEADIEAWNKLGRRK